MQPARSTGSHAQSAAQTSATVPAPYTSIDVVYEFEAPHYYDFTGQEDAEARPDSWFDGRRSYGGDSTAPRRNLLLEEEEAETQTCEQAVPMILAAPSSVRKSTMKKLGPAGRQPVAAPIPTPKRTVAPTPKPVKAATASIPRVLVDAAVVPPAGNAIRSVKRVKPTKTAESQVKPKNVLVHKVRTKSVKTTRRPATAPEPSTGRVATAAGPRPSASVAKPVAAKPKQPKLTQPQGFTFLTDARVRQTVETKENEPPLKKRRVRRAGGALTEPKPFTFADRPQRPTTAPAAPFVSLSEQVAAFHKPAKDVDAPAVAPSGPRALTVPHTPHFSTTARKRKREDDMTTEEREVAAMAAVAPFRAQPVNRRVLDSAGEYGVPKVAKPKPTEPITPETLRRSSRRAKPEPAPSPAPFKAQPVPESLYRQPTKPCSSEATPRSSKYTVPHSPALLTKQRAKAHPAPQEEVTPEPFKAAPMPAFDEPSVVAVHRTPTHPEPFALATDKRHALHDKSFRAQQEAADRAAAEAMHFKAQGMPDLSTPSVLPWVPPKPTTAAAPFRLATEARGQEAAEAFRRKVEEEMAKENEQFSAFRAKDFVARNPFMPKKSERPLTAISTFDLNTERRASARLRLSEVKKTESAQQAAAAAQRAEQDKRDEEERLKELRASLVHRAGGVKHYKNVVVRPSARPLTEPRSPKFQARGLRV